MFALWFLAQGKTPGKWLAKIRVVDKSNGSAPGLARMLVRETFGKMISGFFVGLGYFWAIWDRETQCWHDKIAGTLVVRGGAAAGALAGNQTVGQISSVQSQVTALTTVTRPSAAAALSPVASAGAAIQSDVASTSDVLLCSNCGTGVPPGSRFCEECGGAVA